MKKTSMHSMWGLGLAILLPIPSGAWEVLWRSADLLLKKPLFSAERTVGSGRDGRQEERER